ncbi:hypothetical protein BN3658_00295 [Coriobacteriaceae bacterium CHKCI002]|nr:hypothetical protein BN3658_00295 [Coriobacteriaceae bacterium CHKCI002]
MTSRLGVSCSALSAGRAVRAGAKPDARVEGDVFGRSATAALVCAVVSMLLHLLCRFGHCTQPSAIRSQRLRCRFRLVRPS